MMRVPFLALLFSYAVAYRRGAHHGGFLVPRLPLRQTLRNHLNVQYHATLEVGGQRIDRAILDTGSFELLVVSKQCKQCRDAPYDPNSSATFRPGPNASEIITHEFGSGPTESQMGYEQIQIGTLAATNQTFFQIVGHKIKAMNQSDSFTAIVGIGPPNPNATERSLLTGFGVSEFSLCLQRSPLAPGWLTWGGGLTAFQKKQSMELRVIGKRHWAVSMRNLLPNIKMSPEQQTAAGTLLCQRGCAAVLDSGTSLISAPSHALQGLELLLPRLEENCSNFPDLPDLELELDGYRLTLPPEAYVMRLSGKFVDDVSLVEQLYIKPQHLTVPDQCFYGFLTMNAHTDYGPLWVLGMPFFRHFHTTFDISSNSGTRRIWIAEASDACEPLPTPGNRSGSGDDKYEGIGVYPKVVVVQRQEPQMQDTLKGKSPKRLRAPLAVDAKSLRRPVLPALNLGL